MRSLTTLIFAVCFGSLSSCESSDFKFDTPPRDYENLEISLDRSSCYGGCPSYVVKVSGDGNVSYCGFTGVEEQGKRTHQINPDDVRSLYDQILAAGFFNLDDEYFANITDGPSYHVSVFVDGQTKAVRDYYGQEAGMPKSVTVIQDAIDDITGTSAWIGNPPNDSHLGAVSYHIPDCEDEFRPGAKAFRKSLEEMIALDSK